MIRELTKRCGVSGAEEDVSVFLLKELQRANIPCHLDSMGNLHAEKKGEGKKILLMTYMDEPGIIITQITSDGYLKFETVGRIKPYSLVSKKVHFGDHTGIISLKAIHLTDKKERKKPIEVSQLFIDIGASNREEALKIVEVGEYGSLDIPYREIGNWIKGRAIAGRIGCSIALNLLKSSMPIHLEVIFASQNEVSARGSVAAVYHAEADYAVVLSSCMAKDYNKKEGMLPDGGKGVVLLQKTGCGVTDNALLRKIKTIADRNQIPVQWGVTEEKGAEFALINAKKNIPALCLALPVRYPYTTTPMVHQSDWKSMESLISLLLQSDNE